MCFLSDRRSYYNLERLWAEANRIELPELTMPIPQETWEEEMDPDGALVFGEPEETRTRRISVSRQDWK